MSYNNDISAAELKQIDDYLNQRMTAGDRLVFEQRLVADGLLRAKLAEIRLVQLGIGEAMLADKLDAFHQELKQRPVRRVRGVPWKWLGAASLLLMMSVAAWWMSRPRHPGEALYARYYKPDPGLMTLMAPDNANYRFEKAMVAYKNGQYQEARLAWSQLLHERPYSDTLQYFTAAAAQAAGELDEAIRWLEPVAGDSGSVFHYYACWYLGLAYLRKGAVEEASFWLKRSDVPEAQLVLKELPH